MVNFCRRVDCMLMNCTEYILSFFAQAPRKQLASKAARKSAPSTGGVKKPHRFRSVPFSECSMYVIILTVPALLQARNCCSS